MHIFSKKKKGILDNGLKKLNNLPQNTHLFNIFEYINAICRCLLVYQHAKIKYLFPLK